jgi:hypothetical protein
VLSLPAEAPGVKPEFCGREENKKAARSATTTLTCES